MSKRFGGMVGTALMGLVVIGLGGAAFLETHAPDALTAAAPQAGRGPLVAFSADNAALAGLLAGSVVPAQAGCGDVRWQVIISPQPAAPNTNFQIQLKAFRVSDNIPLRIDSAAFYFKPDTLTAYRNAKSPQPDKFATNPTPAPTVSDIDPATGCQLAAAGKTDLIFEATVRADDGVTTFFCVQDLKQQIETADPKPCKFEAKDYIVDTAGLLPLNDWAPIFGFNMSYSPESAAVRALTYLDFTLTGGSNESDWLEFALVQVGGKLPDDPPRPGTGPFLYQWNAHGLGKQVGIPEFGFELPVDQNAPHGSGNIVAGPNGNYYLIGDNRYMFSFAVDNRAADCPKVSPLTGGGAFAEPVPRFNRDNWLIAGPGDGVSYILYVRTTSTWQTGQSLSFTLNNAVMQPFYRDLKTGQWMLLPVPFNQSGPVDQYTPDFFKGETLISEKTYSSAFGVYDIRGGLEPEGRINCWNEQTTGRLIYTPAAQFVRPRWDLPTTLLQAVSGEMFDIRQLFSVEAWVPVLGIDIHGGDGFDDITQLNMVFTDIGANPYAPPGDGGFDPRDALHPMSITYHSPSGPHNAYNDDFAFNGVWLYHDTNGNGQFDPPTPDPGSFGITFTDFPMYPNFTFNPDELIHPGDPGFMKWHYEPFPPGGGDPWWKMPLMLGGMGRRRINDDDKPLGYIEPSIDVFEPSKARPKPDYFVVMHPDSGADNIAGPTGNGDGVGMRLGADMRVFVEPRRWNPRLGGRWDGGMLTSAQYGGVLANYNGFHQAASSSINLFFWQDSKAWDMICDPMVFDCPLDEIDRNFPWWPERTHSQDTVKPLRGGAEVHDLTLLFHSDNRYCKATPIMAGQYLSEFLGLGGVDSRIVVPSLPGPDNKWPQTRTGISLWTDPSFINPAAISVPGYEYLTPYGPGLGGFPMELVYYYGIMELRFFLRNNPGISPDTWFTVRGGQAMMATEYAFETVPFKLLADAYDPSLKDPRSTYFPAPPDQPTLPRYSTWSGYENRDALINWGDQGRCYLADDKGNNTIFADPGTNGTEKNYADDVYVFVCEDPKLGNIPDVSGKWLVLSDGGRYRILSNQGSLLTLEFGHSAYLGQGISVSDYPYGVPEGQANAVERGRWEIVHDTLPRGTYPRLEDWTPERLRNPENAWAARLLKQYIEPDSMPTAMLGINLCGTKDRIVNAAGPIALNSVTVAFWGPDFKPSQLAGLDPDGALYASGVMLYEDSNGNGTYDGPLYNPASPATPSFTDRIVALEGDSLYWLNNPEPIDLDGDFVADDMSGDGVVFLGDPANAADVAKLTAEDRAKWDGLSDLAWVLELRPNLKWNIPQSDARSDGTNNTKELEGGLLGAYPSLLNWPSFWLQIPTFLDIDGGDAASKALDPTAANLGDDLFVVVRTSLTLKSFSQFRAMIPAKLPTRTPVSRVEAGIQLSPRAYNVVDTATKPSPEESPVQDYYGHDMMPANVYTKVIDLTDGLIVAPAPAPVIQPGGLEAAVLGLDTSSNRPENLVAQGAGTGAQVGTNTFTVADTDVTAPTDSIHYRKGQGWTGAAVGLYLIGYGAGDINNARIEGYEITAVNGRQLTLRAGTPRTDKPWFVVKDPTFLEQVVVEFYDYNRTGKFDLQNDLFPLTQEDPFTGQYSGVALYRDNDAHPQNRNGVFDPPIRDVSGKVTEYIDLPLKLDHEPILLGTVGGEPEYQVKFVFSSPGTDNLVGRETTPYESQPRNRQWVPQTAGLTRTDPEYGPDFFVVVRPSNNMALGDRFQAAIVSWGPNTPSEPDPDNFTVSIAPGQIPGQSEDEFDKFSEFPWGNRAVGYITMFQSAQKDYYWGYDKDARKVATRADVDRSQDPSQDGNTPRAVRNWVRTNPWVYNVTLPVTSLAPPQLDFVGVPTRQLVNKDVQFTLLGVQNIGQVKWSFGDGTTSTEINPLHKYAATGFYTVSVEVVNEYGIKNSATKVDYIEILEAPFAEFIADPVSGSITPGAPTPALAVTFTDASEGGDSCTAVSWFWNFGDGTTSTEQNPVHRYTAPGIYSVTLQTTFQCSDGTVIKQRKRDNYVTVLPCVGCQSTEGEGEATDVPAADIKFSTLVKDKEAVLPLSDWVQLFRITMSYGEDADNYAPRILRSLRFYVCPDSRLASANGFVNHGAPYPTDLLEFAVFKEGPESDDVVGWGPVNGQLDPYYDEFQFGWDNLGVPVGTITAVQELAGIVYTMDFIGNGTPARPQFSLEAMATSDAYPDGNSYIIAVRSSATWRSQLSMGVEVWNAQMIDPRTGSFPVDKEGKPIDSYSPNFYDGETLEDEQFYSSSFGVYDFTGAPYSGQPGVTVSANAWNYPKMLYMPLGEFTRPHWNAVGQTLQAVAGDLLQLRTLTAIDEWKQVLGINVHSTRSVHFEQDDYDTRGPQLREVNVILTDIGANPYGPPGNGGFNPRDGLKPVTTDTWGVPIFDDEAFAKDITYNGIWVWYDANNNGVFDPPTMKADGGVTFNGDFPMIPSDMEFVGEPKPSWEYIPLPPGGGDPWWKMSMRFIDGDRKFANVTSLGGKEGFVEAVPDNHGSFTIDSEWSPDYFVVIRTDSGYKDVSLGEGDGSGIMMGADFRAFIEPRRDGSVKGTSTGGILVDSQIPAQGVPGMSGTLSPWQNDPRWLEFEPWWPQRTMNQNSAKPLKVGVEVHDLTLTYQSRSQFRFMTDLFYQMSIDLNNLGQLDYSTITIGGYSPIGGGPLTGFDQWLDPFGLEQGKFQNGHSVDVTTWRQFGQATVPFGTFSVSMTYNETETYGQYAYETVPFFNTDPDTGDAPPAGPRSTAYPTPPAQPALPELATWSAQLRPGEYPRASQWAPDKAKARLLTQKTEANSFHTAMLGINLIGDADPYVNNAGGRMTMSQISVAFWGPDFTPDVLKPLNPKNNDNQSLDSGVLLWEDADLNGVFLNTQELSAYQEGLGILPLLDSIVPVTNVAWGTAPELVDINGDGRADDMNGDGVVDDADRAWVLTFFPKANWVVPQKDGSVFNISTIGKSASDGQAKKNARSNALEVNGSMAGAGSAAKALDPTALQPGDDLFITVSTSDKMHRFQQFRAVVPATLPTRAEERRKAGIQFYPQVNSSGTAFVKGNPDEDPVQDFYGWDMLESNVPLHLVDMTNRRADIDIGGGAIPVVGVDAATNRSDGTPASGGGGIGLANGFRVPGAAWTANQYKGDWLVDSGYETYEITGNAADELSLLSGTPRNGTWRIVRDPSFLEEMQVELYVEKDGGSFNPLTDLLPLDIDQRISGVALYRDNDNHPDNRNGIFDPDLDIPIALDAPPRFSGQTAEDIQVKFVFSTPGTDDFPLPKASQTRHRQWVQDTFGSVISDGDYGPDFFVVVRAAQGMQVGDKFRAGIVSWGPNTPTEPDPDTWANLPGEDRNDYTKFREFPWADRGVGFVTFFKNPMKRYFMDGAVAGVRDDNSGFNWLRSHSFKKRRSGLIEARVRPVGPTSMVIDAASEQQLPSQTLPGDCFPFVIYGSHFGANPVVVMSGYDVAITSVSDTAISLCVSTRAGVVPQEPVVLLVRNPVTGEEVSRSDLFTIVTGSALHRPKITGVTPSRGTKDIFPVTVTGENFGRIENMQVSFGGTLMPVLAVSADGTSITVGFPTGGLPDPGKLDVTVRDASKSMQDVLLGGFEYENQAVKKKFFGLLACSGGDDTAAGWADMAVLLAAAGALFAARRRGAARAR